MKTYSIWLWNARNQDFTQPLNEAETYYTRLDAEEAAAADCNGRDWIVQEDQDDFFEPTRMPDLGHGEDFIIQ